METKFKASDFKSTDGQVHIIRQHLLNIIVCAPSDMPHDEIERRTNEIHPCGTSNGWTFSDQGEKFRPVICADDSARTHFVLWA